MRLKFESMYYKIDYVCSLGFENAVTLFFFLAAFDVCGDCMLIPYVLLNYFSYCEFYTESRQGQQMILFTSPFRFSFSRGAG
jgi:hypothetical protein